MIYMINSFDFKKLMAFSLKTSYKPESRKSEKTIPLIQIVSDKLQTN